MNRAYRLSLSLTMGLSLFGLAISLPESQAQRRQKTVGELLKGIEKDAKKVDIKKKRSALPSFRPLQQRSKVNLQDVQPPSRSTLYYEEGTNEAELEQITEEQIRQLYKLTQQFKTSKRRGELWLRLAEAYVEKARLIEYRLQTKYDEELDAYNNKKQSRRPKLNLRPAQEHNKKAIQLYEWFLRDYPKDPKVPQALFFLGYNYYELNKEDIGTKFYQQLSKKYPKSPYVDEANFALGEYFFDRADFKPALNHYAKVARNKRARLYSFALYKAAWSQYKLGKVKAALGSLEYVIRDGRQAKGSDDRTSGGVSRIRLASEAVKDLVIFYAEAGSPQAAKSYFDRVVGPRNAPKLLEKLAYYYVDTGNKSGARDLFKDLIESSPNAPKAYDYQYQIVSMYSAAGASQVFRQELYNWINSYGPESSWAKSNAKNPELVAKSTDLIETTLRNYILQQHQTAQNSKAPHSQELAKSGYDLYFSTFNKSPKLDEMHFFFAELLFDMGQWEASAYHYLWVAENAPKSEYSEKASLNALLALEKKLPSQKELKEVVGESTQPIEFDRGMKMFEKAAFKYVQDHPNGDNVVPIKYKLATLYYYFNHYDRALAIFNEIVDKHPKTKEAEFAANLILDIYNIKKDFVGLEKAGQKILSNETLASAPVGGQVKGILQRASFKKAQELEAGKNYLGAAQSYEAFAKENPRTELTVSAYYNAGVNYERAGDLFGAIGMYAVVAGTRSKEHEGLSNKSSKFIAALYEKTGQYEKAAQAFESYAKENPKDKESVDFYYNAGVIRQGLNHFNTAIANYEKYYDLSRKLDRVEVLFQIGQIWETRGNLSKAQAYYEKYMNSNPMDPSTVVEASFLVAQISEKRGRKKNAEEWYEKTIGIQRRLAAKGDAVGVPAAAESKFKLVYKIYEDLRAIDIPANPAAQAKAVNKKLAVLEKLKEELKSVIKYDDGHQIVAALTLTGQAYQHMAAAIYNAPLPKGLDAEGIKQYKEGVEKVARPFQDEALKSYTESIERGYRLEGYNDWLKIAKKELHNIDPAKYPNFGERAILTQLPDKMGL